jgi:prophage antirepressor-like protein
MAVQRFCGQPALSGRHRSVSVKIFPSEFEGQSIRRIYDEDTETWWFSVIDVVQVLT